MRGNGCPPLTIFAINITRNTPDMENVIDCLKICPFFALELLLIKKRLITLGNKSLI